MKFVLSLFLIVCISFSHVYSQTETQIKNELQKEKVETRQDVLDALKKRNMTEDDARTLAAQYGMDYDTFISTYIIGTSELRPMSNLNTPTEVKPIVSQVTSDEVRVETEAPPQATQEVLSSGTTIDYFGYNLFKNIPASFEPSETGPVDPGYLIGPGDVLNLSVWGAVELQYQLTVDQQGNVFIPTAGQFFVSGISYEQLQNKLTAYLSRFYEGLASDPPTVFLDISLAKLRPIKIFVMGEVARPGGYNISSFATVFNALYAVGGPTGAGSLRDVRVIRNNRVITTVDIYDYMLQGQLIGDIRLQNNDMIFIPPRGRSVTIKGEVLRPAIYELKNGENLEKLLSFAGGLKPTAYVGRAQVERIVPFEQRTGSSFDREITDIDLSPVLRKTGGDVPLYDNDIITIFPILEKMENFVTVSGSVYRPGTYELNSVPRISDLIKRAEGVLPETYYGKADIIRTRPDESYEFISIDLARAIDGDRANNIELQARDQVKIYSIYDLVDRKNVSISGHVKTPFTLPYADSLTLYDMVFRAGGLQDPYFRGRTFTERGDLIRINPDGLTTRIIPFDLEKLLRDRTFNMNLAPGDKIYIYSANVEEELDKVVRIEGEIRNPGQYPLNSNMNVMDLILQAGGFNERSLRTQVYISRVRPGGFEGDKLSEIYTVTLPTNFDKNNKSMISGANQDTLYKEFVLQNNDIVIVRKNPNFETQRAVKIMGEVQYPGTYILENRRENLLELINKAGGPTSEGYLFGASFLRDSSRVVVDIEKLYYSQDEDENLNLMNGDQIFVPKEPNTVIIRGEVNNPGLYKFIPGQTVKDYVDKAGGVTDSSNYILYSKANGETIKIGFGLFSDNPRVFDGSDIRVTKMPPPPPEKEGVDIGGTIKDIFAILVSAVTIWVLANQVK